MKPKLRPINAFPVEADGRKLICLQDPMKISDKSLFIDYRTYFIITMMDGKNEISDIQLAYTRQFGELLLNNQIELLLKNLDDNLFLEGEKYNAAIKTMRNAFAIQPVRYAELAGSAYEPEPEKLHAQLDKILGKTLNIYNSGNKKKRIKALISPHIDINHGTECYAHSYGCLANHSRADLYIILGVIHAPSKNEFIPTRKDYATPFGMAETDKKTAKILEDSLPPDSSEDEFIHKTEHSIEFQLIFLQHILGKANYKILPILCGGFHKQLENGKIPEDDKTTKNFLDTLRDIINEYDGNICIIAGVDLSHVGTRFGSVSPITPARLPAIESLDKEMLEYVVKCDARGFYKNIEMDKNGRNVCGFGAIYTLLYLLGDSEGELLYYGQSFQPETASVVTFTSIAFY